MPGREWYVAQSTTLTPAGTAEGSPQVTSLLTGDNWVQWIRWRFPPGPAGTLSIAFYQGDNSIVPWAQQVPWIIGDDENETAQVGYEVFGSLDLHSWNDGSYDHSIIVSIQYQPITTRTAATSPLTTPTLQLWTDQALSVAPPDPSDIADYEVLA